MIKNISRVLVSLVFVGLLLYFIRDEIPTIFKTLKNVDRPLFLVALLIILSTVVILAKRLQLVFAAEEVKIGLGVTCNLTFIGAFFNNFLPSSVGGDIVKALCASRITGHPVKSVTSVLMDRIFGLFTFILIPSVSLFFVREMNSKVQGVIYSFLALSVLTSVLLFNRSVARQFRFVERLLDRVHLGSRARQIYDGLHNFRNHKGVIVRAMLLSFAGQCVGLLGIYLLGVALGAPRETLPYFFLLVPVVHLIGMLPSLNGLGIREVAYVYFLKSHIGTEKAAAIGVLWLAVLIFMSLIGGLIYLFRHDYHIQFKKAVLKSEEGEA